MEDLIEIAGLAVVMVLAFSFALLLDWLLLRGFFRVLLGSTRIRGLPVPPPRDGLFGERDKSALSEAISLLTK